MLRAPRVRGGYETVDAWDDFAEMERDLGIPTGALQETVRRFNENAAKGMDPDFHKGKKWLKPLDHPPYAALQASVGAGAWMCFTLGGLRVSKEAEVLRADGRVRRGRTGSRRQSSCPVSCWRWRSSSR